MGTNYYSIPKVEDLEKKRQKLIEEIQSMDISNAGLCEDDFRIHEDGWDRLSPWDEFVNGNSIHLGKRSMGWKFCLCHGRGGSIKIHRAGHALVFLTGRQRTREGQDCWHSEVAFPLQITAVFSLWILSKISSMFVKTH